MEIIFGNNLWSTYDKAVMLIWKFLDLTRKSLAIFFMYMCIKGIISKNLL